MSTSFPAEGEQFGRYRILRRIGQGGMGVVFAAVQESLGREVALKVLSSGLAQDPVYAERFAREATALARLDSPHVIHVYDHGEVDGQLFIAAQLVPDGDMGQLLKRHGPPTVGEALDIVAQLASGLADAHDAGLIHRDIKPANVLIRRRVGELIAYLNDFGIARVADTELTRPGGIIGSPAYMAPELHDGGEAGVASDIYSLGCVLWAALTGRAPYVGTSDYQVITAHLHHPIPHWPGPPPLTADVNRVLQRAMAKDPAQRYPDARTFRHEVLPLVPRGAGMAPVVLAGPDVTAAAPGTGASGQGPSAGSIGSVGAGSVGAGSVGSGSVGTGSGDAGSVGTGGSGSLDRSAFMPAAGGAARHARQTPRSRRVAVVAAVMTLVVLMAATAAGAWVFGGGDDEPGGATPTPSSSSPTTSTSSPTPTPAPTTPTPTPTAAPEGDLGVAVASIVAGLERQGLEPDQARCAAEGWVDAVGLERMVATGVLTEDLVLIPDATPPSDVTLAGVTAVLSCGGLTGSGGSGMPNPFGGSGD